MDYEENIKLNSDIIFDKVTSCIENSTNILHKKAVTLIKGLKEQIKGDQSKGITGIKNYTKSLLALLEEMFIKLGGSLRDEIAFEENLKNADALIFSLAICIKHLPITALKGAIPRIVNVIKNFLTLKRYEIRKYTLTIVEKLILAKDINELNDPNDQFVEFLCELYLEFLEIKYDEIQKLTSKSLASIFKNKKILEALRYSLVKKIRNFYIGKLRGLKVLKDPSLQQNNSLIGTNIQPIQSAEGEIYLKTISLIIQYLPFDIMNELIVELSEIIENCDNYSLIRSIFSCFDLAFSSKNFAIETSEKIFQNILSKEIIVDFELDNQNSDKKGISFGTSLILNFIKCLTSIYLNIIRTDPIKSLKYLSNSLSILGEYFSSRDSYIKSNIYNSLNTILTQIFSVNNLEIFYNRYNSKEKSTDATEEVIEAFNIDLEKVEKFNLSKIYEETVNVIFYLISDRYEDLKPGFNLLLTFIERIHKKKYYSITHPIIESCLMRLAEQEKIHKHETFKIFVGKLFNFVNSSTILKHFPLQILDYDIFGEEYTQISKVWIISYINKFLKGTNEIQTIIEFYKSFFETIDGMEILIGKLKDFKKKGNMDIEMEEEEMDERYIIENDTEYNQNLKLKRYELILTNIWDLFIKFLNYDNNYSQFIKEIFVKLEKNLADFPYLKEKIFKSISKMLSNSIAANDKNAIEVIREDGKKFFVKAYTTVFNNKFTYHEMRESFNLISNFCKICSEKYLKKIICEIIEIFEKEITNLLNLTLIQGDELSRNSNTAKLNESLQFEEDVKMNFTKNEKESKYVNDPKSKKVNILCLRIEIINYILKNMQFSESINSLLNAFFEKYFFNETINFANMKKKLIELFITLLDKMNDVEQVLFIFHTFSNKYKGLDQINTKQKAKLFEFILDNLLKKLGRDQKSGQINDKLLNDNFHIFIEIISLTKDLNRKVRNISYEMIGKLTDFMQEINLYHDWVKIILGVLASNSIYLKSAGINALARIFWQNRSNSNLDNLKIIVETFDIVLLFFKEANKEIIKSIYLFIRVLLYVLKTNFIKSETTKTLINQIIHYCFFDASKEIQKEFKVKNRNLLKTLILNFSYEEIKKLCPPDIEDLIFYVNKHMVKKIKNINKEEEEIYGKNLDYSVIMDNEEFYIDEEEEFIDKEFKKLDKKKNDDEFLFEKINKFKIYEDDPELIKKHNLVNTQENKKQDKIEELFNKDNIELDNFFYINPYAIQNKKKEDGKKNEDEDDEDDVVFNVKTNKLEVREESNDDKSEKPRKFGNSSNGQTNKLAFDSKERDNNKKMLNKKRVKNVMRDINEESDEEIESSHKNKGGKSKNKKQTKSHIVKFSGEEYKNKGGKGDKLLQGKYEPFAYIQLNPQAISKKKKKDNLEVFENLMKKK